MAKHTEGAVHLTSLSLDLTQFNENIQQIQNSTAEVADVAVQNLSKIKEALNVPTEQMRLSVDTTQLTQDVEKAQVSVEGLGNAVRAISKTIQAGQLYDASSIQKLKDDLGLTGKAAKDAQDKLEKFFNEVKDYDKITFTTSGGKLFQAIIETSDEAGKSIRRVVDLSKEFDAKLLNSSVRVTDNAEKRNLEITKSNERFAKSFDPILSKYDKLYEKISKSTVLEKGGLLGNIEQAKLEIQGLQDELRSLATIKSPQAFVAQFEAVKEKLKGISALFDEATAAQKKMLKDEALIKSLDKSYEDLQKKIAFMLSTLSSSKFDNTSTVKMVQSLHDLATTAEQQRKSLKNTGTDAQQAAKDFDILTSSARSLDTVIAQMGADSGVAQKFERLVAPIAKVKKEYDSLIQKINKSELDIDTKHQFIQSINTAQEEIEQLKQSIAEVSTTATKTDFENQYANVANTFKNITKEIDNAVEAQKQLVKEAKEQISGENFATKLSTDYAHLQNQLLGLMRQMVSLDIPDDVLNEARTLSLEMEQTANEIRTSGVAADDASATYKQFAEVVALVAQKLGTAKLSQSEYEEAIRPTITTTKEAISSLKTLEKTAVFKTSKDKVAALRAEYEEFLNKLKNTNIGVDTAERELSDLQKQFDELESTVKRGNGTLENWVNKITESAKWQIANSALNLLQQSFGQLTTTIIDTEDAVIELRRVLNDKSLVDSEMTQTLYDIAYEFGQTFGNVQEVAVKFAQTGKTWEETVAATRATMLGLNTAELEVSTATEGLIAVMAQFNVEADDLEKVIDKINITADNFPVTSEKIVAALQRAGGTANAFNMTLDETIATITALAEKTGRSGENIGTALNSLIIFTSKSENLKLFSSLSAEMDDVVKKFQAGSGSIIDVWTQLSKEIGRLSKEQEDALFNSAAFEQFASQFEAEAAEYAGTIQQIYGTAGAYRRNYLTVLLQDMSTVEDVMANLTGAIGYSLQENEVAMESFSKKWNQLIVSAKELAIQFGESGFLDSMKLLVDISSSVLSLTKNIGGLNTVLLVTSGIILKVKQQKIIDWLTKTSGLFRTGADAISIYNGYLATGATRSAAFAAATNLLKLSMGDVLAIAGLAVTGVSMAINAYQNWQEEIKKARDEAIQLGKESVQQLDELGDLYLKYSKAKELGDDDTLTSAKKELVEYLGVELHDLEILVERNKDVVKGYEDIDAAIQTLLKDKYALEVTQIQEGYDNLLEKMGEVEGKAADIMQAYNVQDPVYNYLKDTQASWELFLDSMDKELTTDNVEIYYKVLQKALADVEAKFTSTELAANDFYNSMSSRKDDLEAWVLELAKMAEQEGLVSEGFEAWVESLVEGEGALEGASTSTENFAMSLEEMEGTIDSLNKKMDDFQSSVKSVENIITQYNQTGVMTADMLQTLIGLAPEYIDLIDINSGSLSLNQEKLENLMKVNDNYMVQMAAMKIAKEYEALSTELQQEKYDNLTVAEIQNMITTNALGGEIYQLAMQLYSGQINAEQFKKGIQQAGEKSGLAANKVSVLTQSMADLATSMGGVIQLAGMFPNLSLNASVKVNGKTIEEWEKDRQRGIISEATFQKYLEQSRNMATDTSSSGTKTWFPSTTAKTGGGGAGGNADKFKAEKDALSDLLEVYEHSIFLIEKNEKDSAKAGADIAAIYRKMQDEVHAQADRYRKAGVEETDSMIAELSEKWWSYQDKIEEVLHGIYEETVASHERAINVLEHQYDSAEQRLDYSYMGENLKKQLDYQVKIQKEAERELERLAELGMDANSEAAQDVIDTWYDAEKAIRDVSQKIQESILQPYEDFIDLADKFDIWEYMDFTKVDYLRMELQEVNNMLANGTMSLKEYNAQLKQLSYAIYDAQKELFDKQKADVEAAKDEVVKNYKSDIDSLKDQKQQIEDYYKTVIDGYNAEIDAWEDRKDKITDYYDTLIDNLNDVQAANERINAQVDYYNERQKIVTNLEQAQARSGVEWREKEMEYQQSLIDLDEEWNRTQKEWDIQDQIDMLNELKERALADIDLSIQAIRDTIEAAEQAKTAAIEGIEAEIAGIEEIITATEQKAEEEIALIDEQFKVLSQTIAEAIKNGTADGIVNTQAEIDKALVDGTNAMLDFIDSTSQTFVDSSQETANTVYGAYDTSFITPMYGGIDSIVAHMQSAIPTGASAAAQEALRQFQSSLVTPLKQEMASLMSTSNTLQKSLNSLTASTGGSKNPITAGKGPVAADVPSISSSATGIAWRKPGTIPFTETATQVFITNNNVGMNTSSIARKNQQQLMQELGLGR